MKKITKITSLLLCMAMMVTLFAGCGSKGEEKGDLTKIEVWSQDSHSKSVVTDLIANWNETKGKQLGVEIVYTVKEGNIQQAVEMAFASEQEPDFFSSCPVEKFSSAGYIVAINTLPGGEEYIQQYKDNGIDMTRAAFSDSKGDVYCVPSSVITFGLVYNKDMFKKYGLVDKKGEPTPPKTFEEVREYAKKMTDPKSQDYGIIFPMKWASFVGVDVEQLAMGSTGVLAFDPVKGEYDFSVFKPIYEMYLGIKKDGSYFPGPEALDNDTARAYFAERNIGMKFAGSYDVGVFNTQFPAKCDWGVAPYPVENENERYMQYMMAGGGYGMSKKAVEKIGEEKAFEIFKFLHGDEYCRTLYQKGMSMPYDFSIVKDVKVDDGLKGWEEFTKLTEISTPCYNLAKTELTGVKTSKDVFMEEIWTGKKSVDKVIDELNQRYNQAMKTFYDNNPSIDFNSYLKPKWDTKLTGDKVDK